MSKGNPSTSLRLIAAGCLLSLGAASLSLMVQSLLESGALFQMIGPRSVWQRALTVFGAEVLPARVAAMRPMADVKAVVPFIGIMLRLLVAALVASSVAALRRETTAQSLAMSISNRFANVAIKLGIVWTACGLWVWLWILSGWLGEWSVLLLAATPQFVLAIATAAILIALCDPVLMLRRIGSNRTRRLAAGIAVALSCVVWIAVSYWMNRQLYAGLLIPHGDSGMYEEHLWNVTHGKGFRSYLDQGLFLGEHIQVIHLLLIPLHYVWPHHLTLELAESLCLGLTAIPIYRIAHRHSGSRMAATFLAIGWLVYFPMHFLDIAIDLKTFRPIALGIPAMMWMLEFAERKRLLPASLLAIVTLSAKEDYALVLAPVFAWLAWSWHRDSRRITKDANNRAAVRASRWAAVAGVVTIGYLLTAVLVIIPEFRGGDDVHFSQYFGELGSSPGELVRNALADPGPVLAKLLSRRSFVYLAFLTLPVAGLCFRSPGRLATGILTFSMLCLIEFPQGGTPQQSNGDQQEAAVTTDDGQARQESQLIVPFHHFHAPLLPIVFWAAACGLPLRSRSPGASDAGRAAQLALRAPACAVALGVWFTLMPLGFSFWAPDSGNYWRDNYASDERGVLLDQTLELIPLEARVASTDYVHTRMTHFERSYDYSGYLRAASGYQQRVPDDTDYIVIDTGHRYSTISKPEEIPELAESPERWELLPDRSNGMFIVLRRRPMPD